MFELLAATGLRRSQLLALEVRPITVDGAKPSVRVRQRTRWQKAQGQVIGPLKSACARRELPIPLDVADRLRPLVVGRDPGELVFASPTGRPYDPSHLWTRILAPACAEAGVEWAGFHTFRHTVASRMFASGRNAVQVQHWLGHHSAAFTLKTYVHLLALGDLGGPLEPARAAADLTVEDIVGGAGSRKGQDQGR
jgi:integrase